MRNPVINKIIFLSIFSLVLISGVAIANQLVVSNNSPEGGYLLCANKKSKVVTFPGKLICPPGTNALDLGAITGVAKTQQPGYLVELKPQDVIASVTTKPVKVLLSKSKFRQGYYSLLGEVSMQFESTSNQSVLCRTQISGSSWVISGFPSHEVANTWKGYNAVVAGVVKIEASNDVLTVSCTFTGNTKVIYGYISLLPISAPQELISD